MKKNIVVICILLACCRKPLDLALPVHEPRLVLHGYVSVGELFEVAIGKSIKPAEEINSNMTWVDNAWVVLYENGVALDSLHYDAQAKRYRSQWVRAIAGKTYTIKAGADGFPIVEATATASLPVNTISTKHEKQIRTTYYGEKMDDIKSSFQDPANEKIFISQPYSPLNMPAWVYYVFTPPIRSLKDSRAIICLLMEAAVYPIRKFCLAINRLMVKPGNLLSVLLPFPWKRVPTRRETCTGHT